jgi:hydrogenase maturation protease
MKQRMVIAYGNPLRGDDGVGWKVAQRLEALCDTEKTISVVTTQQLTPELAESLHQADQVLFVDASVGNTPGQWKCEPVTPAEARSSVLGHHFDAAGLLAYTLGLYGTSPAAQIVSVTAKSFDLGGGLSPEVEAVLPAITEHIRRTLHA